MTAPTAAAATSNAVRLLTLLLASLTALVLVGVSPASAASQVTPDSSCNQNHDTGTRNLNLRGPKIWSNNGTAQTVRYRSQLWKWNGTGWSHTVDGQWRSGTAYPNSAWQDSARSWDLRPYGGGAYRARIQVQYLSGGSWTGTENAFVPAYYLNIYSGGRWYNYAADWYCPA